MIGTQAHCATAGQEEEGFDRMYGIDRMRGREVSGYFVPSLVCRWSGFEKQTRLKGQLRSREGDGLHLVRDLYAGPWVGK